MSLGRGSNKSTPNTLISCSSTESLSSHEAFKSPRSSSHASSKCSPRKKNRQSILRPEKKLQNDDQTEPCIGENEHDRIIAFIRSIGSEFSFTIANVVVVNSRITINYFGSNGESSDGNSERADSEGGKNKLKKSTIHREDSMADIYRSAKPYRMHEDRESNTAAQTNNRVRKKWIIEDTLEEETMEEFENKLREEYSNSQIKKRSHDDDKEDESFRAYLTENIKRIIPHATVVPTRLQQRPRFIATAGPSAKLVHMDSTLGVCYRIGCATAVLTDNDKCGQ